MSRAGYDPQAAVTLQETFVRLVGAKRRRRRSTRATVREPPAIRRARREEPRDARDAAAGRRPRPRALSSGNRNVARARSPRTRRTTTAARRSPTTSPPRPSASRSKRCGSCRQKRSSMPCSATSTAREALRRRDRALWRRDRAQRRFFYYHLQKGLAHRAAAPVGHGAHRAREQRRSCCPRPRRITRSARSPSSAAIAQAALEHYARAAQSEGEAGAAAQDATVRLDLPANPGKYFAVRGGLDNARPTHRRAREPHALAGGRRDRRRALCRRARRDARG